MHAQEAIAHLIDDDTDVRQALRWLVESVQIGVREFGSIAEFLESPRPAGPGCIVLDVRMPGMSGMEFLNRMVSFGIDLPVVMLTGHGTIPMATRALRAGAVDFLQKPFNEDILLDRVQEAVEKSRLAIAHNSARELLGLLSAREDEVVRRVAAGRHNKEIARELGLSPRTVEAHRAQAMQKLGVHTPAELTALVLDSTREPAQSSLFLPGEST